MWAILSTIALTLALCESLSTIVLWAANFAKTWIVSWGSSLCAWLRSTFSPPTTPKISCPCSFSEIASRSEAPKSFCCSVFLSCSLLFSYSPDKHGLATKHATRARATTMAIEVLGVSAHGSCFILRSDGQAQQRLRQPRCGLASVLTNTQQPVQAPLNNQWSCVCTHTRIDT